MVCTDKDLLLKRIMDLKEVLTPIKARVLDLVLAERIAQRLTGYAPECEKCRAYIPVFLSSLSGLKKEEKTKAAFKGYHQTVQEIKYHLQKVHNLIPDGHYAGGYMSLGVAWGLLLGVVISFALKNYAFLGTGMPIGIGVGYSVGASKDEKAKTAGLVI